jgi:hypothetical protein
MAIDSRRKRKTQADVVAAMLRAAAKATRYLELASKAVMKCLEQRHW